MTPYPLIYCPPGVPRPRCCPHGAAVQLHPAKGPDAPADPREAEGREWGVCWGGPPPAGGQWIRTGAGWWLHLDGHKPQTTVRLERHPRVLRWKIVPGAELEHAWHVPVLLTRAVPPREDHSPAQAEAAEAAGYIAAIDRLLGPDGQRVPSPDLAPLMEPLMAIALGHRPGDDVEASNRAYEQLAIGLLAVGHYVDPDLIYATGWLSERTVINVVRAGFDRDPPPEVTGP
ncbi:MAG TPA: hypothetical protein VD931_02910 [Baekduia sp.]|nr:hypothetical protein [Baekduia sp.]